MWQGTERIQKIKQNVKCKKKLWLRSVTLFTRSSLSNNIPFIFSLGVSTTLEGRKFRILCCSVIIVCNRCLDWRTGVKEYNMTDNEYLLCLIIIIYLTVYSYFNNTDLIVNTILQFRLMDTLPTL